MWRYVGEGIQVNKAFRILALATAMMMGSGLAVVVAAPASAAVIGNHLDSGASLGAGDWIESPNGAYRLVMQDDGNLVEYAGDFAMWQTATAVAGSSLVNQVDGDLVVTGPDGAPLWTSGTAGQGPVDLFVLDSGVFVAQAGDTVVWTGNPAGGPTSVALGALTFAEAQIGKPYLYGAEGPDAYDASGLTKASYGSVGITLPHNAAAQYSAARRVSRANLRLGDLVFYGTPIHHVGIYAGLGMIIHAPGAGNVVRYAKIEYLGTPVGYGRVA